MSDRPTQKLNAENFNAHISKKSKFKGWLIFVVLLGVPLVVCGGGYWFQKDTARLVKSIEAKDAFAPFAAWAIGAKGDASQVRDELRSLVTDQSVSAYLRRGAASALGTLKDEVNTSYLDDAARNDPDAEVRAAACSAIGVSEVTNGGPTLEYVLVNDTEPSPLAAACEAAGKLGHEGLISLLIDNLGTTDYRVRTAAREALETFYPEGSAFGDDPGRWRNWYQER
jgi:HEAT repeat protein